MSEIEVIVAGAAAIVAEAATRLDARGPADWFDRIDLDDLDVASVSRCVLGQVYESFSVGMSALYPATEIRGRSAMAFGMASADLFNRAWTAEINSRRRAKASRVATPEPELELVGA